MKSTIKTAANLQKDYTNHLRILTQKEGIQHVNKKLCESLKKKYITSSVYDCTVEDVVYIYNKLSIHIFNSKSRLRFHSNA